MNVKGQPECPGFGPWVYPLETVIEAVRDAYLLERRRIGNPRNQTEFPTLTDVGTSNLADLRLGTIYIASALSFALAASGCAFPEFSGLKGKLRSRAEMLGGGEGGHPWGVLAFDGLGSLTLNGQVLSLPSAQETHRFGVSGWWWLLFLIVTGLWIAFQ